MTEEKGQRKASRDNGKKEERNRLLQTSFPRLWISQGLRRKELHGPDDDHGSSGETGEVETWSLNGATPLLLTLQNTELGMGPRNSLKEATSLLYSVIL